MDKLGVITSFIHNIVVFNIPQLYGTVGEIVVEKYGSLKLGVEGIMAVGAIFGYMIGALFADLNVAGEMERFITGVQFSKFGLVIFISLLTCFLGMVVPGSSLVVIFGPVFITTLASVGVDPLLAAAMLPCICGVMCGITPPLGLGMYAGMSLAGSDFDKTFKNNVFWVVAQFVMEVVVLMGWLPILGL